MAVVYKYDVSREFNEISLPLDAVVLRAEVVKGRVYIWVLCDESEIEREKITRNFVQYYTGDLGIDRYDSVYIDTVFNGELVIHLFEVQA